SDSWCGRSRSPCARRATAGRRSMWCRSASSRRRSSDLAAVPRARSAWRSRAGFWVTSNVSLCSHVRGLRSNSEVVDEIQARGHAEELIPVHDDGNIILAEQRHEISDQRVGGTGFEPRHHYVLDRTCEGLVGILPLGKQRSQHVALIDQADDTPPRVYDGKLRDIGGAHPGKNGAQVVLRAHDHGGTLAVAADHHVAH